MNAIGCVLDVNAKEIDAMLERFFIFHKDDHLLLDKWFTLKAMRARTADEIHALTQHASFTYKTPNRVYALVGSFTGGNLSGFHNADGTGYQLLADSIIILNGINPQVAARMANGFRSWGRYDAPRRKHAQEHMQRVLAHSGLSNDVFEIISRTLNG
jgi:aminopeptidase N